MNVLIPSDLADPPRELCRPSVCFQLPIFTQWCVVLALLHPLVLGVHFSIIYRAKNGGCSRRTRLFGDQLDRADAGSWQIADRYATAS
mgnify:CR=1 FL=1